MSNSPKIIRTRYAPSPTGLFHIGGARTALFNYLYAKANNGIFIVRIENTDVERNVENGIDSQINNLKWLKIFPDESYINPGLHGPYIQSEKFDVYEKHANRLLSENKAYRCFCTPEELEQERKKRLNKGETPKYSMKCRNLSNEEIEKKLKKNTPYSIRLKLEQDKEYKWNDLIRGDISFNTLSMSDPIILKSNKVATYNFAVVIDDYDMEISHILRGEEHISNTPYQLAIKEALNFNNEIKYGHLSVIVDETGKKLSKRNIELKQFIEDYRNMGFPEVAITNFLCLLGWSRPDNKEIFSLIEASKEFKLEQLSSSPTFFDFNKMLWVSSQYFKEMEDIKYLSFVQDFVTYENKIINLNKDECLLIFKNQISYAKELDTLLEETFGEKEITRKDIIDLKLFENKEIIPSLESISKKLKSLKKWDKEEIQKILKDTQNQSTLKGKDYFKPIRFAATAREHGPELYKIIYLMGKDIIVKNINSVLSEIKRWEYEG